MQLHLPKFLLSNTKWLEQQQTSILSAAVIITVATGFSTLSGLLRQRLLMSSFLDGTVASEEAFEALLVAFQIPDTLFQLVILGALSAAFIPLFTSFKKTSEQTAFHMTSIMMNLLLLVFAAVAVVAAFLAEPLTMLRTGHEFTLAQVQIVTNLTRIMLVAQFFFAISNFLSGILQSYQRFIMPAIAPVLYNVGIVLGVYLFAPTLGIYSAGVGVILGAFIHMIIQVPLVLKLGFKYSFSLNFRHPGIKEFFKLMPPRMLALSVNEIRKLSLGFFATSLGNFSFVVIQLALTLMTAPIRFFGVPISQASLPFLSEESSEQDLRRFKDLVQQSLNQIAFLALPASVLLLILRVPIVRLLFGTDHFSWPNTLATGRAVAIIAVSITAQALTQLLVRSFYALKDTKTPLLVAVVDIILYIVVCAGFVFWTDWGVLGIATATTITAIVEFMLLLLFLDRKVGVLFHNGFWLTQVKMMSASFLMAVFLYLPFRILDELVFNTSRTLELLALTVVTSTIGLLVYIYFAALFEIKELHFLTSLIFRFGPWRKQLAKTEEVLVETPVEGNEV